ncbi:unnamed protein product [Triticum turgidum subsp. durum]|uniref:Rab-GAP TBC domain-containing protein n=1 Tax=Triticum turgidum subsp. durum TaxID=4567 RepID=A0A9R0Q805_TRITD|nr:unnamed protein product [Triticum turgidum subsp. durum]
MWAWGLAERAIAGLLGPAGANGGRWNTAVAVGVTAAAGIALVAIVVSSRRGGIKSPWRRRRKRALGPKEWRSLFTPEGKFYDGGVKLLKRVRNGGVEPSIRAEVWPFLLGVYSLNSSEAEREAIKAHNRKGYMLLRKHCLRKNNEESVDDHITSEEENPCVISEQEMQDKTGKAIPENQADESLCSSSSRDEDESQKSDVTHVEASRDDVASVDQSSVEDEEESMPLPKYSNAGGNIEAETKLSKDARPVKSARTVEDFETWQRIIRLDAVRANNEWVSYSPLQAAVTREKAIDSASAVCLKDYDHLEAHRIHHASRLVAILEAYATYDPEIGYCQGMSDLLAPLIAVLEEDDEAFWCFAGFMRKARHNFRLDEVGIRRQLNMVSKIIKTKDFHLYRHLEMLEAADCFFVYRMVVVMFRRELTFEQTLSLWEVMWADQAARRAGIARSSWGKLRLGAPPTDDLLLYAIAASVLEKRKLIIESYSSMDEIIRDCNSMAGQLDIWKLLDDAHDLVVTVQDRIE